MTDKPRSLTTQAINCMVPNEVAELLREWAPAGRYGLVISRLVHQEAARREERERLRRAMEPALSA